MDRKRQRLTILELAQCRKVDGIAGSATEANIYLMQFGAVTRTAPFQFPVFYDVWKMFIARIDNSKANRRQRFTLDPAGRGSTQSKPLRKLENVRAHEDF